MKLIAPHLKTYALRQQRPIGNADVVLVPFGLAALGCRAQAGNREIGFWNWRGGFLFLGRSRRSSVFVVNAALELAARRPVRMLPQPAPWHSIAMPRHMRLNGYAPA